MPQSLLIEDDHTKTWRIHKITIDPIISAADTFPHVLFAAVRNTVQQGDELWVLYGAQDPYALRPAEDECTLISQAMLQRQPHHQVRTSRSSAYGIFDYQQHLELVKEQRETLQDSSHEAPVPLI